MHHQRCIPVNFQIVVMDLVEGKIIAEHYKLIKQLGHGSFGNVWLAHNLLADIDVAIKFYGMLDQRGLEEFREEFKIAYSLRHPNLLNINHFDVFENCPYLVMPYCERGDVGHRIGKMSEAEIWKFVTDVSNGLSFLHANRPVIIHQDIKPNNILITADGHYVITDFGISFKIRTQLSKHSRMENSNGTIAYMGPERLSKKPKVIIASDIWSFGATLYEIMEGKLLWEGQGGIAQLNQAELPDIEKNYSPELLRLVKACLAANPWDRPMASVIYNYAVAFRRHQPLPDLNPTAPIIEPPTPVPPTQVPPTQVPPTQVSPKPVSPTPVHFKSVYSNRPSPKSEPKHILWKRWMTIAAACMCGMALLSGSYFFIISPLLEESRFLSCENRQDYERFLEKHPNSSYAEKARKKIAELTPATETGSPTVSAAETEQTGQQSKAVENSNTLPKTEYIYINNNNVCAPKEVVLKDGQSTQQIQTPQPSTDKSAFIECRTLEDYQNYLTMFPNGKFRNEAISRMQQLAQRRNDGGQTRTYTNYSPSAVYNYPQHNRGYNHPTTTTSTSQNFNFSISVNPGYGRGFGGSGPGYHGGPGFHRGPGYGGYHGGPGSRR